MNNPKEIPDNLKPLFADEEEIAEAYSPSTPVNSELETLLSGFQFPAAKGTPTLMLGRRNRIYLKGAFRNLLGVEPQSRVIIGYRPADDAFAIALPRALAGNYEAQAAGYFVSKRYDVTAAKLFKTYRFNEKYGLDRNTREYFFDKASSDASVAIFRRF